VIRELPRQGLSISEISRQTGHDRRTIRKMPDDPRHPAPYERRKRGSNLDPYKPYLRRQTAAGVLNAVKLVQEVRRQDYTGGITLVPSVPPPVAAIGSGGDAAAQDIPRAPETGGLGPLRTRLAPGPAASPLRLRHALGLQPSPVRGVHHSPGQGGIPALPCQCLPRFAGVPAEVLHDNLKTAVYQREPAGQARWCGTGGCETSPTITASSPAPAGPTALIPRARWRRASAT